MHGHRGGASCRRADVVANRAEVSCPRRDTKALILKPVLSTPSSTTSEGRAARPWRPLSHPRSQGSACQGRSLGGSGHRTPEISGPGMTITPSVRTVKTSDLGPLTVPTEGGYQSHPGRENGGHQPLGLEGHMSWSGVPEGSPWGVEGGKEYVQW